MSCTAVTLGSIMATDEIGEALVNYFEKMESGRCKTCQTPQALAKVIEDSDVPPGLGLMYLNWVTS